MSEENDTELPALLLEKDVSDHLKETWKGDLVNNAYKFPINGLFEIVKKIIEITNVRLVRCDHNSLKIIS